MNYCIRALNINPQFKEAFEEFLILYEIIMVKFQYLNKVDKNLNESINQILLINRETLKAQLQESKMYLKITKNTYLTVFELDLFFNN